MSQLVKWQDDNAAWHTGKVVPGAIHTSDAFLFAEGISRDSRLILVRESCDGALTWVPAGKLERWAGRDEWEDGAVVSSRDAEIESR